MSAAATTAAAAWRSPDSTTTTTDWTDGRRTGGRTDPFLRLRSDPLGQNSLAPLGGGLLPPRRAAAVSLPLSFLPSFSLAFGRCDLPLEAAAAKLRNHFRLPLSTPSSSSSYYICGLLVTRNRSFGVSSKVYKVHFTSAAHLHLPGF